MRHYLIKIVISLIALHTSAAQAETVNVFFAGGQSNAKTEWASGIESALIASNLYENVLVVHQSHSGSGLHTWYQNGVPQSNFETDFYNSNGTGALQTALNGADTVFSGFFWFQGEADSGWEGPRNSYTSRFNAILDNILANTNNIDENFHRAFSIIDVDYENYPPYPGISLEDVDAMRDILFSLAGDYYYDTRGLERYDRFHLTTSELYTAGYGLGEAFTTAPVPIPAAIWLFCAAISGLFLTKKKFPGS